MSRETADSALDRLLLRGWATLGLPLATGILRESDDGLVDPEGLVITTLAYSKDPRLLQDVALWLTANQDLVIHQKLTTLRKRLPEPVAAAMAARHLDLPAAARRALHLPGADATVSADRRDKLTARSGVAQRTRMIHNRLLFGAAFRADIVSLLECRPPPRTGRALAFLVGANPSTVSRVLDNLSNCGFVDGRGRIAGASATYPGLFLSTQTAVNLAHLFDALRAGDTDLRRAMLPDVDPTTDRCTATVMGAALAR